jgi:hypothetical protein
MLFLKKHQKSVRPLLEVHSGKICEVRFGCFLDDDIEHTTQVFITCIMIICPFSSSHFATQIFSIDELRITY